jgi:rhodanese-related sulfurtransferase
MNDITPPAVNPGHDSLSLLHVLTIVVVGAALGLGFNALQLSADSSRGLPWVKSERRVVSLEGLSSAPPAAPAAAALPVPGTVPLATARTAPQAGAATPVRPDNAPRASAPSRDAASSAPAKATATPVAPATPAKAPAAGTVPAPAASAAPAPAAAGLPVIPDSRDPIEVGVDVVQRFHAAGAALFLDARSAEEYAEGHIAGAVNLPFDDVYKNPALAKAVDAKGRVLVTYCGGGDCDLSRSLAFSLIDAGFRKVLVFTGGLPAWASAGRTVNKGAQP